MKMKNKVFLLFKKQSETKVLIGVFPKGKKAASKAVEDSVNTKDEILNSKDIFQLCVFGFTTTRTENYSIEEFYYNELIQKKISEL